MAVYKRRSVRQLSVKERECAPASSKLKKAAEDPRRRLTYNTYETKRKKTRYCIIVEIKDNVIELYSSTNENDAKSFMSISSEVIPCFWNPKVSSHLTEIFTPKVLSKLVEQMKEHRKTWSVAHICVSLPLPEDTMMILLASDTFKDHFTSVQHPKGYTLLHLAIEQNSLSACRAIMRCSDLWLFADPGFHIEDKDGLRPIQKAVISKSWVCLEYLAQSQSVEFSSDPEELPRPRLYTKSTNIYSELKQFQNAVLAKRSTTVKKMLSNKPDFVNASYIDGSTGLHKAHDPETIITLLEGGADPQIRNQDGDTPLHTIIKTLHPLKGDSWSEDKLKRAAISKQKCIVTLLTYGNSCDPNCTTGNGMTPLHLAVEACDVLSLKTLLAFNADISITNDLEETPLDMARRTGVAEIVDILQKLDDTGDGRCCSLDFNKMKWPPMFNRQPSCNVQLQCPEKIANQRDAFIDTLIRTSEKFIGQVDPTTLDNILACAMETYDYSVDQEPVGKRQRKGDRVLCLDGGGIRGLILIELLSAIEETTGKKITDLFDWIVGTSTGGILALAMVYTNLSLSELRSLYFQLKDKVFHRVLDILPHADTSILEAMIKDLVSEHRILGCKSHPKVLITATDIECVPPKLVFFSNYEDGEHGKDTPIWEAARATSAAPVFFEYFKHFADGGIKANNPTPHALVKIHEHYTQSGRPNYKVSTVVSLGCGDYSEPAQPTDVHKCLSNWTPFSIMKTVKDLVSTMGHLFKVLQKEVS